MDSLIPISISVILVAMIVGVLIGQLTVWRHLRKKGRNMHGGWIYTATKCTTYGQCDSCRDSWACESYRRI